jgi:type I restriction enzyme S subunit
VVHAFHLFAKRIYQRIDDAAKESATLVSMRDTLLPKLISGELRIKQAADLVEQVA